MKKNLLEWSVFAASLVLIACCVGVLAYQQVTGANQPPDIRVEIGQILARPGGFAVEVLVQNDGDRTAEAVRLAAYVDGSTEAGEAIVEYLPYRSRRRAWIMLPHDPRGRGLRVHVLGFEEP